MCAITGKRVEESSEGKWGDVLAKRMQEVATHREMLTPARNKVKDLEEEMPKGNQKAPPTKVPACDDGGRGASTSQSTTAKQAAAVGQAC